MIFATVGTQLPFDRMLGALDAWASQTGARQSQAPLVRAQTGVSGKGFGSLDCAPFMPPQAFRDAMEQAMVIVAHAGMGTILTAAELGKPIVIMPRKAALGEHRNDHQYDTAAKMAHLPNVTVAETGQELSCALDTLLKEAHGTHYAGIPAHASPQLISAVAGFIEGRS